MFIHPVYNSLWACIFVSFFAYEGYFSSLFCFQLLYFVPSLILIYLLIFSHYLTFHFHISIHSLFFILLFCSHVEDLGFASIVYLLPPFSYSPFSLKFLVPLLCCAHTCVCIFADIGLYTIMSQNKIRRGRHDGVTTCMMKI